MRRPAAVLPTGAGKTVVFSDIGRRVVEAGGRFGVLAHRDELIAQAVQKIHDVAPGLRVGVFQGSRREVRGVDAVVASVQSLTRAARREELARAGLSAMIVDECHHATASSYMSVLQDLGAFAEPGDSRQMLALGVTATMIRGDGVALGEVWEDVVFRLEILDMIRQGYLSNAVGLRVRIDGLDLSRVARSRGDWQGGALGQAMSDCMAPEAVARAIAEKAPERQGIVFVPTVKFAYEQAEALSVAGFPAIALDGKTPVEDRRLALKMYRAGSIKWLCNVGLFTEGTDLPMTDCIVIARPTSSVGLYMQMAGRGLRPYPGKENCLIMDVVGATVKHKMASFAVLAGGERVVDLNEDERAEMDALAEDLDLLGLDAEVERKRSGEGAPDVVGVDGDLAYEEVSLFDRSHQQWLRTAGGAWCLVSAGHVIALAPVGDRYSVACMPLYSEGGRWVVEDVDMSYAMSWGEQEAERLAERLMLGIEKDAQWRTRTPVVSQRRRAKALGIEVPKGMKAGQLANLINAADAANRIDHLPMFREESYA